jgi:hypothetical protein
MAPAIVALLLAGCGTRETRPPAEVAKPALIPFGTPMVVPSSTPDGGAGVHIDEDLDGIGIRVVEAGATVVTEDPGPPTEPNREVVVLVDAFQNYRGKARITLGQLRPVPLGGFPRPTLR